MQIQINVPSGHPLAIAFAEAQAKARQADFYNLLNHQILREIDALDHARDRCEALIERLIAGLDEIDGDPDLEPSLGSSEAYTGHVGSGTLWNGQSPSAELADCEAQCDDEGFAGGWRDGGL